MSNENVLLPDEENELKNVWNIFWKGEILRTEVELKLSGRNLCKLIFDETWNNREEGRKSSKGTKNFNLHKNIHTQNYKKKLWCWVLLKFVEWNEWKTHHIPELN